MEWTHAPRPAGQSLQDFFAQQIDREDDDCRFELIALDCSQPAVCYGAYRYTDKRTGQERVSAAVIRLAPDGTGEAGTLGYQLLTEYEGPRDAQCPPAIYEMLTRFRHCEESPLAKAWRDRVEAWHRSA